MTEMVCVSETGRITPGCSGLYTDSQRDSWREIVDFVHARSTAKIGVQLGHSGRKGSTKLMWEGIDEPLPEAGNWRASWPLGAPYGPGSQAPREIDRAEMEPVRDEFVAATAPGRPPRVSTCWSCTRARLPALLLPLAAGQPARRRIRRHPREPAAVPAGGVRRRPRRLAGGQAADRAASRRPTGSTGGNDEHDAVAIARAFVEHGADGVDVSSGQVVKEEKPAYGRSYQTPFADRIRQEVAAPGGRGGDRRRRHVLLRRRQLDPAGGPRGPLRPGPHAPVSIRSGPCMRPLSRTTAGPGADWPQQFRAGQPEAAGGPHRRGPAPAGALCGNRSRRSCHTHLRWTPASAAASVLVK